MNVLDFMLPTNMGEIKIEDLGTTTEATDLWAPRADLRASQYEFLICLLQTVINPETEEDWAELWEEPPSAEQLLKSVEPHHHAFELDGDGPAFMQDFDFDAGKSKVNDYGVERLFLETPTAGHFVKTGRITHLDPRWAALALFCAQNNSTEGGSGHRVSVRGGGPMTTLVLPPPEQHLTLWHKLWINVLSQERWGDNRGDMETPFPWLQPTVISKNGAALTSAQCHPLHSLWGMPRRIRLKFCEEEASCSLTGDRLQVTVIGFKIKSHGNNYKKWLHPHSPYLHDKKNKKPPSAVKGQPGGITYQNWSSLYLDHKAEQQVADVVSTVRDHRWRVIGARSLRIWITGFDAKQMKTRCWYETKLPLYIGLSKDQQESVSRFVDELLAAAKSAVFVLEKGVDNAIFLKKSEDRKNPFRKPKTQDTPISNVNLQASFYSATETLFYKLLQCQIKNVDNKKTRLELQHEWWKAMPRYTRQLFDRTVLTGATATIDYAVVAETRKSMLKKLWNEKSMRKLKWEDRQ